MIDDLLPISAFSSPRLHLLLLLPRRRRCGPSAKFLGNSCYVCTAAAKAAEARPPLPPPPPFPMCFPGLSFQFLKESEHQRIGRETRRDIGPHPSPSAKPQLDGHGRGRQSPDEQSKQRNEATNYGKKVGRLRAFGPPRPDG